MAGEGRTLVGTMVGGAVVSVVLVWALVVHGAGRRRRADALVAALLALAALRQAAMAGRAALGLFRPAGRVHGCGLLVWAGASVSTLQGAVAATLALCLAARGARRYSRLVTRAHLAYHLVCAALLSSCVGVAAVLAAGPDCLAAVPPDPRYSIFSLALRAALALLTAAGLLAGLCLPTPRASASDLGSLSSRRSLSDASLRARHFIAAQLSKPDLELMSTTSSTNSRAYLARPRPLMDVPRPAVVAILLVTLFTNQIPMLTATAGIELWGWRYPFLSKVPDWSTLAEGVLLPIAIFLCDRAFVERLSKVYSRPKPPDFSRPPQAGAYGKFMPRGSMAAREGPPSPVRFPITNGSLFASLDPRTQPHRKYKGAWYWAGRLEGSEQEPVYASLSAKSACSATTQANSDFEFFCNRPAPQTPSYRQQEFTNLQVDSLDDGLGKVNLGYQSSMSEADAAADRRQRMSCRESQPLPREVVCRMRSSNSQADLTRDSSGVIRVRSTGGSQADLAREIIRVRSTGGSQADLARELRARAGGSQADLSTVVCRVRSTGGSQADLAREIVRVRSTGGSQADLAREIRARASERPARLGQLVMSMDSLVAALHGPAVSAATRHHAGKWDSVPDLNRPHRPPSRDCL